MITVGSVGGGIALPVTTTEAKRTRFPELTLYSVKTYWLGGP